MNVHWTAAALADLRAIESYIARRSDQYARVMIGRIFARCGQLTLLPQSGPTVPEYGDDSLRELFVDPYRIIYRLGDTQIDIIAVVHAARRLPKVL